jgi:predicted metal-dependent HD superfamily phosphohydrolase
MKDLDRWLELWRSLEAHGDPREAFAGLEAGYGAPDRFYHTMAHVRACLEELDQSRHLCARPTSVELALWFHDVVYEPRRADNEERSAARLLEAAGRMGLDASLGRHAADLVLQTAHGQASLEGEPEPDAAVARDVDLTILGQGREVFDAYEAAIKREYAFLPESEYRTGRAEVLAGFRDRPRIYHTSFFMERYEKRARANIARSLEKLYER